MDAVLRCPVCRADNTGTTCRRCRADLSLVAALAAQRRHALAAAQRAVAAGQGAEAVRQARIALASGGEAFAPLAAGYLLQREFAAALAAYRRHREHALKES